MQPCPPYTTRGSALKGAPFRSYVPCEMRATRSERNPHPNIGHCADGGASYSMSAWIPTPIFAFSAEFLAFPGFIRLCRLPLPPSRPRCGMRWRTGQAPSAPFPSHLLDHVGRALSSPLPFRWPALGLGSVRRASSAGFVKGFGGFLFLAFLARLAARTGVAVPDAPVRGSDAEGLEPLGGELQVGFARDRAARLWRGVGVSILGKGAGFFGGCFGDGARPQYVGPNTSTL